MASDSPEDSEPSVPPPERSADDDELELPVPSRGKKLAAGLAFGIGSAAVVAALLFANRSNAKDDER